MPSAAKKEKGRIEIQPRVKSNILWKTETKMWEKVGFSKLIWKYFLTGVSENEW